MARNPNRPVDVTPQIITFAGIDDKVEFKSLHRLTATYTNVEWGVLVHPEKHGTKRYPSLGWLLQFSEYLQYLNDPEREDPLVTGSQFPESFLPASLHICGEYLDMILEEGFCGLEHIIKGYNRVQFNASHLNLTEDQEVELTTWASAYSVTPIIQVSEFPFRDNCHYLLDLSRGTGKTLEHVPSANIVTDSKGKGRRFNRGFNPGFAGGINPENVADICKRVHQADNYYFNLDMESGVRDADNEFSLEKCEAVLKNVYGHRTWFNGRVIFMSQLEEEQRRWEMYQAQGDNVEEPVNDDLESPDNLDYWRNQALDYFHDNSFDQYYVDDHGRTWAMDENEIPYIYEE